MQRFGQIVSDVNVMHAGPNPVLGWRDCDNQKPKE